MSPLVKCDVFSDTYVVKISELKYRLVCLMFAKILGRGQVMLYQGSCTQINVSVIQNQLPRPTIAHKIQNCCQKFMQPYGQKSTVADVITEHQHALSYQNKTSCAVICRHVN